VRFAGQHLAPARVPAARISRLDAGCEFQESWRGTLLFEIKRTDDPHLAVTGGQRDWMRPSVGHPQVYWWL